MHNFTYKKAAILYIWGRKKIGKAECDNSVNEFNFIISMYTKIMVYTKVTAEYAWKCTY